MIFNKMKNFIEDRFFSKKGGALIRGNTVSATFFSCYFSMIAVRGVVRVGVRVWVRVRSGVRVR